MSTDAHGDDLYAGDLYAGDPATFVARRDQLVRDLRAAGQRGAADAVKALRRPTASAAAVNALVRSQPQLVDAVLAAADLLAQVQRRALSGLAGADVRGAVRAHHAALAEAVAACAPSSQAMADEVRATLLAAGLDDEVADRVRRGVLATAADPPDASEALLLSAPLGVVRERAADADVADVHQQGSDDGDDDRAAVRRATAEATALAAKRRVAAAAVAEAERQLARAQADRVAAARKQRTATAAADAARAAVGPAEAEVARLAALLAAAERERDALAVRAREAATEAAARTTAAEQAEEAVTDAEALLAAAQAHLGSLDG